MVSCALCLKDDGDSVLGKAAELQFIEIFSADTIEIKINYIIEKHLGILYDAVDDHKAVICLTCWGLLWNFHQFYDRILKVQKSLKTKVIHIVQKVEQEVENNANPLPEEEDSPIMKCEKTAKQKFMVVNEDFFDAGKVEVQDFELLPQIEIIEDISASTKNPMNITQDDNGVFNYDDNKTVLRSEVINTKHAERKTELILTKTFKRRQGRPRKCKNVATIIDGDHDNNDIDGVVEVKELNDKHNTDNKERQCCDNKKDIPSEDVDNDNTNDDSDSDYLEDEERYAKLDPPRIPQRPTKYRKHNKPRRVVQHMTREEVAQRNKIQVEYERIIKNFFKKFLCPKCDLLVHNFKEMRQHFRTSHAHVPCFMSCCGRKFFQRKALVEHIYVHWNPEHFKCKICERILHDGRALELHEKTHLSGILTEVSKTKKTFQCDKCPRIFTTKAAVEYHIFSKHVPPSEFKFSCNICLKKLPTERKLREHVKCTHDPESAIICDKCGKTMRSQTNLKKHHEVEHSQIPRPVPVPQQCEICGTWLRHLSGLKQHVKTMHENSGGEHRCNICNKLSTNARALKRHIYHNHECERKFKCTMCEKAFKRPQDLREHTSTHTGEVLYTCPNCPMTFFSNANMYKHRQRLHRAEYEADRRKPRPQNIMQQAVAATAAMKNLIK